DLRAHSKPQFRQAVANQFYNEFKRIYAPLKKYGESLATAHAIEQELAVHKMTIDKTYRNQASSTLTRLKKRPLATSKDDVGIDGEWTPPASINLPSNTLKQLGFKSKGPTDDEIWRKAKDYV